MNPKSGLADSPFFTKPVIPSPKPEANGRTVERNTERSNERTIFRSEKRTADLPTKRLTKRYSFEFYEDQLMKLKQLRYQAEMDGKRISLSDIVRQALDDYLQKKAR